MKVLFTNIHEIYLKFIGCFKEVWINHKPVDFTNAARQVRVTPGCALLEEMEVEAPPPPSGMLGDPRDTQVINYNPIIFNNNKIVYQS